MRHQERNALPPAIEYLFQLKQTQASDALQKYFGTLQSPKQQNAETFIAGVKSFMEIANLNPEERKIFYGNSYLGLHYNNDLENLWNTNCKSPEIHIESHRLSNISPPGWDHCFSSQGTQCLVYRGDAPSSALDRILQGPTVIDCGMFCQLSLWFGIRYMLGNDRFNQLFSDSPFYITQILYSEIPDTEKAYLGNPLYPFLQHVAKDKENTVYITHVANHGMYQIKHPGGNSGGQNCVLIREEYTIFAPFLTTKRALQKADVEGLLLEAFNAPQDKHDESRLHFYSKQIAENPEGLHPNLGMTYASLIDMARALADTRANEDEFRQCKSSVEEQSLMLGFDLEKFLNWVAHRTKQNHIATIEYTPLADSDLKIPPELTQQIPHENRKEMTFSNLKAESPLHNEIYSIAMLFCQRVMSNQSSCVILTGKAGIGKTASAASSAKELVSRGKKLVWISELTVKGWTEKVESMGELEQCRAELKNMLANNPDAVFLDDDNLAGFSGIVLLEEIYAWYVSHPGKGLYITSNNSIKFTKCYGWKIDGNYHYPPFPGYVSEVYQNTIARRELDGQSLRPAPVFDVNDLSYEERLTALYRNRSDQSVGVIVDYSTYESGKIKFNDVEFIAGISYDEIELIQKELQTTGRLGDEFEKLTPYQKNWIVHHKPMGFYSSIFGSDTHEYEDEAPYETVYERKFHSSESNVIAIEILQYNSRYYGSSINTICQENLLRLINYAHDQGGKKIIIINHTEFSSETFLQRIKDNIPKREKERTIARLDNLLFSPALFITKKSPTKKSNINKDKQVENFSPITDIFRINKAIQHDIIERSINRFGVI